MNRRTRHMVTLALALLVCLAHGTEQCRAAPSMPRAEAEALFSQANADFSHGVSLIRKDRPAGEALLRRAAGAYQSLVEGGFDHPRLEMNRGNTSMLLGDVGRAVLHYRRALRGMPGDPTIAANLTYARQRVTTKAAAPAEGLLAGALSAWLALTPPWVRWWSFALVYGCAWLLAGAMMWQPTSARRVWGWAVAFGILACILGVALLAEWRRDADASHAVLIADRVTGMKGPDQNAYQPSFTEPLGAGLEVRVVEERPGWTLVRLRDGRETWVPAGTVERI